MNSLLYIFHAHQWEQKHYLLIVGEKKEIKDFCMCFWKELERKRERIYLENLQFFFSSSRGLGGIYGKNLTLQLLVAP